MDRIVLHKLLPKVFAHRKELRSDVWLQDVTLERGNIYLLEASSGTGKSSLCSFINGHRSDYDGKICFDDKDVSCFSESDWTEVRMNHLSLLFQELRLFPELTALENVLIKNQLTSHLDTNTIKLWFERLEIADKMHSTLKCMSFGQQQRVAMIRALAQPFDFILLDEPISHLDERNAALMADLLMEQVREKNATVLVTSIGKHMDLPYDKIFKL